MHYGLRANIFEGGVFHGQNGYPKCLFLSILEFLLLQLLCKTPPYGENLLLKSEQKYSPNISPHIMDAAGGQISDL